MRLVTLAKIVLILVVVLIAAVVGALLTLDVNEYKGEIASAVKDATGRALVIDGDIALELGWTPSLGVAGVRFANAPWGSRPDMVRLDKLSAEVALLPLIRGELRITRIVLRGADILLETDGGMRANWVIDAKGPARPKRPATQGAATIPTVNLVAIENARLTWRAGKDAKPVVFALDRLDARAEDAASPVLLSAEGAFDGNRFSLNGTLGAPSRLTGGGSWPLDIALLAGGAEVTVKGAIADPVAGKGVDLVFSAQGKDLSALGGLAGTTLPKLGPYRLSGRLNQDGTAWRIADLGARLGNSALTGSLSVDPTGERPRLDATLTAKLIDIADFDDGTAAGKPPGKKASDGRVFGNEPLPVDGLRAADAAVTVRAEVVRIGRLDVAGAAADISVRNGEMRLRGLRLGIGGGKIGGEAEIAAASQAAKVNLRLKAAGVDIGAILKRLAVTDAVKGALDADVQVSGSGRSVRALMAGLNGTTSVVMGEGSIDNEYVDLIGADLVRTVAPWAPAKKGTRVNCLVSRFLVRDGIADSRALLFDTDLVTVGGKGKIDLRSEKIDLKLLPRPKDASLLSLAVPINIGGTLAAPTAAPDEVEVAKGVAGAVLGSVINPLGILLPLVKSGSDDRNPCVAALAERRPAGPGGTPAAAPPPPGKKAGSDSPTEAVGDAVKGIGEGIGKGLKSLFGR